LQYWTTEMEKQVGDRVQTVLKSPMLLSVYEKFGAAVFRRSSVFHGLEKMLTDNKVSGRCCFEIGTWNALTAAVLSQFFDEVVTVDVAHNALKREVLAFLNIQNVRCVDILDNGQKAKVASRLDFDFAYLDGDHANDTGSDWELTRGCGRVLFHECWPFQKPVFDLVNSLPPAEVVYGGAGLALWRRA
jgi:hypothetical protein